MVKIKTVHLVWPLLLLYLTYLLSKLIWFDNLSSFANDSVHYLVMAMHYSPWLSESGAIATAWPLQYLPPFFPWILAITGAAHSLIYAHLLVTGLGLVSLYFYYLISNRWLKNPGLAVFPVLIFALSPGFILGLQGILSESLYLLLTFIFILLYLPARNNSKAQIVIAGLLLAAILLTRTIGIALCMGILAQAFFSSISQKTFKYQPIVIAALSLLVYLLLTEIWGPVNQSIYLDLLIRYLTGEDLYQIGTGTEHFFSVQSQLVSLFNSWTTFWIIYWKADGSSTSFYVTISLLLLSLSGLFTRIRKNKYDAWYVLFYLLILLVWPHPGQMVRLLFPVMPFLLIYAGYAVLKLTRLLDSPDHKNKIPFIFYLLILAAVLPSHAFIHTRANMAAENQLIPVYEIFRRADLAIANNDLAIQNQMLKDFARIKDFVSADQKIMYFLPSYLAILSDRQGVRAPSPVDGQTYRLIAEENRVSYIFLTRLHPRNTRPNFSGLTGAKHIRSGTELVWCSQLENGETASCLYKIKDPKIDK